MATRSIIGIENKGQFKYVYCQYDGSPKGVGSRLYNNYKTKNSINKLIKGDIRSIDAGGFVDYYEDSDEPYIIPMGDFINNIGTFKIHADFIYIFADNMWYVHGTNGDKKFMELEKYADEFSDEFGDDEFRMELLGIISLITQLKHFQGNENNKSKNNKEMENKLKEKVKLSVKLFLKNNYKFYPIDMKNRLIGRSLSENPSRVVISVDKEGNYLKLLGEDSKVLKDFYYFEVYFKGTFLQGKSRRKMLIEGAELKRKPNNINKTVEMIYKKK